MICQICRLVDTHVDSQITPLLEHLFGDLVQSWSCSRLAIKRYQKRPVSTSLIGGGPPSQERQDTPLSQFRNTCTALVLQGVGELEV